MKSKTGQIIDDQAKQYCKEFASKMFGIDPDDVQIVSICAQNEVGCLREFRIMGRLRLNTDMTPIVIFGLY